MININYEQKKRIRYMYSFMFRRYRTNVIADSAFSAVSDKPVLGAELIPDASRWFNIDNDPYWTKNGAAVTILGGTANFTNSDSWNEYLRKNNLFTKGKEYVVTFNLTVSGRGLYVYLGEGGGINPVGLYSTSGFKTIKATALGSDLLIVSGQWGTPTTATIDNISVREVLINSVTTDYLKMCQNNRMDKSIRFGWIGEAGSKIESGKVSKLYSLYPNYQIPRRNLLTYTEEFDNAVWNKTNILISQNSVMSPIGTMTADLAQANTTSSTNAFYTITAISTTVTYSIYTKKGNVSTRSFLLRNSTKATNFQIGIINYDTGTISGTGWSIQILQDGWYRILFTQSTGITIGDSLLAYWGITGDIDTAGTTWAIWGAQLEVGSVATDYQRVQEATNWQGSLQDATQTTPGSRPYITGNIAPNEKLGLKNPNGGVNFMTHPTISFAANESWSVTFGIKNFGRAGDFSSFIRSSGIGNGIMLKFTTDRVIITDDIGYGVRCYFTKSIAKFIGKKCYFSIVYNGTTCELFINGASNEVVNVTPFTFTIKPQSAGDFYGGINTSLIIRSQALTPTQVTAEYDYLRSVYPEIESVVIGTQTWATSNCAVAASSNGTVIPDGTLTANWTAGTSYWCHHTNIDTGAIYDKLYNKAAKLVLAANPPEGWHYATQAELTTIAALGGNALKLIGNTYWTTANGTNSTGLSLLGSSKRNADGSFGTIKSECYIWAADSDFVLKVTDAGVATIEAANANDGYALRLVKN